MENIKTLQVIISGDFYEDGRTYIDDTDTVKLPRHLVNKDVRTLKREVRKILWEEGCDFIGEITHIQWETIDGNKLQRRVHTYKDDEGPTEYEKGGIESDWDIE